MRRSEPVIRSRCPRVLFRQPCTWRAALQERHDCSGLTTVTSALVPRATAAANAQEHEADIAKVQEWLATTRCASDRPSHAYEKEPEPVPGALTNRSEGAVILKMLAPEVHSGLP